ncbi:MAG: cytochrome b562 [Acidobacteriota bacterium]|jgi:soluble cytochrome b562
MTFQRKHGSLWLVLLLISLTAPILRAAEDEPVPPIVAHMRQINKNLRTLRGQYDQAALEAENVQLVETIRAHVKAAQQLEPLKTPQIPVDQRAAFLKDFRSTLGKVLDTLDQLEAALKQNDSASAKELILKLNDIKRAGHEKFKSPD